MIFLYTDFGLEGPYVGQMRTAIQREAPGLQVVDLCHDLAPFDPRAAAYLLAALVPFLPDGCCVVGVVDPGVGSERGAVVLEADGRWFVGPDNGLFAVLAQRADKAEWRKLAWRPDGISASFHGRDLFAPAGARVVTGRPPETAALSAPVGTEWPQELAEVVYIDHYGNAMTGLPGARVGPGSVLHAGGRRFLSARTFSDLPPGGAFWYVNSCGLAELALNQDSAARVIGLSTGTAVEVSEPD
ncbi:MAG TPA: SAM-dependent chlorinase/fluorinase [Gammaproteobacteria bacterium]|nr:SAM-dependent chlorinase/fluorinase [Gammaproteobacteria bacterium]